MTPWVKHVPTAKGGRKLIGQVSVSSTAITIAEDIIGKHFNFQNYAEIYLNKEEGRVGIKPSDDPADYRLRSPKDGPHSLAQSIQAKSFITIHRIAKGWYSTNWNPELKMLMFSPGFKPDDKEAP